MGSIVLQETESRHAKVIEMIKAGKSNTEIEEVTGYCRASINKIAKANGIDEPELYNMEYVLEKIEKENI